MTQVFSDNPLLSARPFWVLELTPSASLSDVNKAARELAGKLALGMSGATEYATPGGIMQRDEFLVREAQAILIDPERRLLAEFWYVPPAVNAQDDKKKRITAGQWREYFGVA